MNDAFGTTLPPRSLADARDDSGLSRRSFVGLLGGIVVFVTLKPEELFAQRGGHPYPDDFNAYLRIGDTGRVTLFSGKIEMGQGVHTSLAQMAAEELGVPLESIDMVMGDTDLCPWDVGTHGSLSTRFFGPAVRAAAAEMRLVLLNLASEKLGTPRAQLAVDRGFVTSGSQRVSYAELAKGQQIQRLVGEKAVLRSAKEFTVMGKPAKRLDGHDKVTGRAKYAGDMRLPGMLYARVLRPPMHGATRKSLDTSKAKEIPGVTVVANDEIVAVLHADPEVAAKALQAVKADWEKPSTIAFTTDTVHDYFLAHGGEGESNVSKGDVSMLANSPATISNTFRTGYLAHAPIEPHTAVAEWKDGRLTAWVGTQGPFQVRATIAKALGLDEKQVRVITPFVGGGFGGKSPAPQAVEAALLARLTGKPVMVMFTRPEEFYYDTFGPAAVIRVNSAMDGEGKITAWDYHVYAAGERSAEPPYDIPNVRLTAYLPRSSNVHPFGVGPWRAPGAGMNVFAKESQIDIMAAKAKVDPIEFRLRNLNDPRMTRVLKTVADAFGWKPGAGSTGQGRGIACSVDAGTYCAMAADVAVDKKTGAIQVKRIVAAQDMGIVVNPDGARMQMEGAITMSLGYVLSEELQFRGGEILDRNFDTYQLPRFAMVPHIEAILVKNDDLAPQGGGEPAIVPLGAAIANAVFDATGVRMFRLPMTPERVLAALKA